MQYVAKVFLVALLAIGIHSGSTKPSHNEDPVRGKIESEDVDTNQNQYEAQQSIHQEKYQPATQYVEQPQRFPQREEQQLPHTQHSQFNQQPIQSINDEHQQQQIHILKEDVQQQQQQSQSYLHQPINVQQHTPSIIKLRVQQTDYESIGSAAVSPNHFNFGATSGFTHHHQLTNEVNDANLAESLRAPSPTELHYEHDESQSHAHAQSSDNDYPQSSTLVLVPPFGYDGDSGISDEQRKHQPTHTIAYHRPQFASSVNYNGNIPKAGNRAVVTLQYAPSGVKYLSANELPEPSSNSIEIPSRQYLPTLKLFRPSIVYGPSDGPFKRPTSYRLSNQYAFAPERTESRSLPASSAAIPYPPSFISITTPRPLHNYHATHNTLYEERPTYHHEFRPSPIDPVPDYFAHRQAKSLLDSYIPSWIIAKMLEEERNSRASSSGAAYAHAAPYFRKYKRESLNSTAKKDQIPTKSTETPMEKLSKEMKNN